MPTPTTTRTSNFAAVALARPITATIDYTAGQLIVAHGLLEDNSYSLSTPTGGAGLTWTLQQSTNTGSKTRHYLWTAVAASSQTGQTITTNCSNSSAKGGLIVEAWPAGCTIGAIMTPASGTSGAAAGTITTTAAGSGVSWASGDWAAADGTSRTRLAVNASAGTESAYYFASGGVTFYGGAYADAGAAGAKSVGLSAPTGQNWFLLALEIIPPAPTNTVAPAISGDTAGEATLGTVLTCGDGTWTNSPTITKQWRTVAGGAISGQTGATITLDDADLDVGDTVFCRVTGTNGGGSATADSASVLVIAGEPTGPEPDCFVMTETGLIATKMRVMTEGGLLPPVEG